MTLGRRPCSAIQRHCTVASPTRRLASEGIRFGGGREQAAVVAAWPTLPGPVKAGIKAMVEAGRGSK